MTTITNQSNTHLTTQLDKVTSSQQKISSGFKINAAKDDAAGLQLSNRLLSQLNNLDNQARNTNDVISYYQVAQSGFSGLTEVAGRINELSIAAGNGSLDAAGRAAIAQEISGLGEQMSLISAQTTFGGQPIFSSESQLVANLGFDPSAQNFTNSDLSTASGAQSVIMQSEQYLTNLNSASAAVGALQQQQLSDLSVQSSQKIANSTSLSAIKDTDFAAQISEYLKNKMQVEAAMSLKAQANLTSDVVKHLL
ncbi:flagellin [Pseudoalteromonas tunicata]|uniref:flagellin n=1 Tax=Pseudoalteromonas tunicata TaxID=314281 RepID=UPI00273D6D8A|nr:flagellin [Pseudoalteromonas tunicata]MDP4982527.1 flagellin [Pseudoalteromonas tunicata]